MNFSTPLFFVPERACRADDPRPVITLTGLNDGDTIKTSPLMIRGMVTATERFDYYQIVWGRGANPASWEVLVEKRSMPVETPADLYEWDLTDVEPGIVTLKIYLHSTEDTYAEKLISFNLQLPTPTPTETPMPTETPTPSSTPTETLIPSMTPTPTQTSTVTPTATPTVTETP